MLAKLVNIAPITVVYNVYDTYHYSCIVGFTNQQTQLGAQSYLSCPGGACMENGGNKGFPQQRALRTCGWTPCSTGICLGVTVKKMVGRLAAYRNVGKKKHGREYHRLQLPIRQCFLWIWLISPLEYLLGSTVTVHPVLFENHQKTTCGERTFVHGCRLLSFTDI